MPVGLLTPLAARIFYVVVVVLGTFAGLRANPDPGEAARRLTRALHPVVTARDVVDGLRNLLLFAGFGATWVATSSRGQWQRAARSATGSGFLLSVFVEGAQLFSPVRMASVLDVATNTGGALAGAWITAAVMGAFAMRRDARSYLGVPAFAFGASYALAALCEAFSPLFGNATVPGVWGGPGRRFAAALAASREIAPSVPLLDVALFVPAGALLVAALGEVGVGLGTAAALTAAGGAVLAAGTELARGLSGQPMEPAAFTAHALGLAAGALVAWRGLPAATRRLRKRRRVAAFLVVYTLVLALWAWRPFRVDLSAPTITAEFAPAHFIPLYALGERGDLFSVTDVAIQFLLYLPLGALAAVWPLRVRGLWRGPVPAVALALVLEAGQLVVAQRFFDVTDWLIQSAGVLVGWVVARRAGYHPVGALAAEGGEPERRPAESTRPTRRVS